MTRSEFIRGAAAFAAMGAAGTALADGGRKIGLAAQMYSLRGIVQDQHGFYAMLRLMKDFGYSGAEICGTRWLTKDFGTYMSDIGLKCAGVHVWLGGCLKGSMAKTCEQCRAYGATDIVMPWEQPPKDCADEKGWWKKLGADLSAGAEVAKECGCTLAYHNHRHEFTKKIDGVKVWDLIMSDASDDLKIQFDVGHLARAGEKAREWFGRYANRIVSIHAKEVCTPHAALKPVEGKCGIDWPEMFELTQASAIKWYIVEAEANPADTQKMKYGVDFLRKYAPFLA